MPPILANYYLTYKCNSRCTYCDIPTKPVNIPIKESKPELIIENLAALKRLGVKGVDFTGGEPVIYKHLPEVLKAAKEMGFFTSLANTGTLYPRVAEKIKGLVDDLKFSLSTTDKEEYRLERGIDGYEKVVESVKLARSLGEHPSLIATATPESIWGLEKVVRLAQELGVVVLVGPVFDYCGNDLLHQKGIDELQRLSKMDNVCINWAFLEFYLSGGNQISKPRCRAISSTIVVSPDDHLLLPCYHMHDERLQIKHENGRSNLDEIWRSAHVQTRRKEEGSWSFCQGCTIWCYFETSFLWPPDRYFMLNAVSKARWATEKVRQFVRAKTGIHVGRRLAPLAENLTYRSPITVLQETASSSSDSAMRSSSGSGSGCSSGGCGTSDHSHESFPLEDLVSIARRNSEKSSADGNGADHGHELAGNGNGHNGNGNGNGGSKTAEWVPLQLERSHSSSSPASSNE